MGRGRLTPQDNPEDRRRIDELEETYQPRSMRRFKSDPNIKQLRNTELVTVDDGVTPYLAFRLDNKLVRVLGAVCEDVTITNITVNDPFELPDFTASRLVATDADKLLVSVEDLTEWIAGTANEITVTDDGDGTVTLSLVSPGGGGQTSGYLAVTDSVPYADGGANDVVITDEWDNTNRYTYRRIRTLAADQDYDLVYEFILPDNFDSWTGSNSISIYVRCEEYDECILTITMVDADGNVDSTINGTSIVPTADNTWEQKQLEPGSAYVANERVTLRLHIGAGDASDPVDIGIITYDYTGT